MATHSFTCKQAIHTFTFADDAKYVSNQGDSTDFQKCFCALKEWSDYWLLKLNIKKCNALSLSYRNTIIKLNILQLLIASATQGGRNNSCCKHGGRIEA